MERRKQPAILLTLIVALLLLAFALRHHAVIGFRILAVYGGWHLRADMNASGLSYKRDGFDQSFHFYDRNQVSASEPSLFRLRENGLSDPLPIETPDAPDLVPPILHHILIGMDWDTAPSQWHEARNNCLAFHPSYTAYFWDDTSALAFLKQEYPWFVKTWLGYQYKIQQADSLRYFVLHHYGGVFLDLDLSCRRSLGPLRRFPAVAVGATPVGVSNGFIMASPRHPLFAQLVHAIADYNLNWGHSYLSIMWSTGPMFLSSEIMRYSADPELRLRYLNRSFHRLSGRVITPLFEHGGSSSWHQKDTLWLRRFAARLWTPMTPLLLLCAMCIGSLAYVLSSLFHLRDRQQEQHHRSDSVWMLPIWVPLRRNLHNDEEARCESLPLYVSDEFESIKPTLIASEEKREGKDGFTVML